MFVVYPKIQVIELMDSQKATDDSINKLKTLWGFLWSYCRDKKIKFEPKKWKIYHSRPSLIHESDPYNSGCYAFLYMLAVHHRVTPSKFSQATSNIFRYHLCCHFKAINAGGTNLSLCSAWKTTKGTGSQESILISTQEDNFGYQQRRC